MSQQKIEYHFRCKFDNNTVADEIVICDSGYEDAYDRVSDQYPHAIEIELIDEHPWNPKDDTK